MRTLPEQLGALSAYRRSFHDSVQFASGQRELTALSLQTFQMNIGKLCNQACRHCHVDASPKRTELMSRQTMEQCLAVIAQVPTITTVDITGGAPEMNPDFRWLVQTLREQGKHIIDRCNLTILEEPGYEDLADFLTEHRIELVSSLPHFARSRTDQQRGHGVFDKSILALQKLNARGYGRTPELKLNLVYNPSGLFLSQPQAVLEREFKEQLQQQHGVVFHNLYCINNLPINRFLESLLRTEKFDQYMEVLVNAFNPATLEGLMCRHQISVGYDGQVYDCDFNQMLEMNLIPFAHIADFDLRAFLHRNIALANHCFGCTVGAGSSCGGELVPAS